MSKQPADGRMSFAADDHAAEAPPLVGAGAGARSRRAARAPTSPHAHKFRAVTGGLVGFAVATVVVAIAILSGSNKAGSASAWSQWKPPDSGSQAPREIADHLAPFYRISSVDQLAVVTIVNLSDPANPLNVAVRPDANSSTVSVVPGTTVAFNLCGLGPNCAISAGQPSPDRLLLLRREALELALYTFRYDSRADNVVAILPPGHTTPTSTLSAKPPAGNAPAASKPLSVGLLFLRQELQPWLDRPLSETLPEQFPPPIAQMRSAPEAGLVQQITARGLFQQRLIQAQDGSRLIVLDPVPPQ
jgi:hypothetical protein